MKSKVTVNLGNTYLRDETVMSLTLYSPEPRPSYMDPPVEASR
jgi:hypothetical protein